MFNESEQHNNQNKPSATAGRRVLVAYPVRYAQQDENGRLTLDPAYASELRPAAAPADPVGAQPVAEQRVPVWELGILLMVGTGVILLDQLTKRIVEARMPLYSESVPLDALFPYFRFTHTANYGAAFGMFQDGGLVFGIIAAIVAIAILIYNFGLPPGQRLLRIALGLQLGGALGNLIDRLRLGYVTDFLDMDFTTIVHIPYFSDWPIFNLADTSIVAGVLLLAYLMLTMEEPDQAQEGEKQTRRLAVRTVTGDE